MTNGDIPALLLPPARNSIGKLPRGKAAAAFIEHHFAATGRKRSHDPLVLGAQHPLDSLRAGRHRRRAFGLDSVRVRRASRGMRRAYSSNPA